MALDPAKFLFEALTYDDVLLVPAYSEVLPRDTNWSGASDCRYISWRSALAAQHSVACHHWCKSVLAAWRSPMPDHA